MACNLFWLYLSLLLPQIPSMSSLVPGAPLAMTTGREGTGRETGHHGHNEEEASPLELTIFELINKERARHKLTQLEWDPILSEVARGHSEAMLKQRFFDHTAPAGSTPMDRVSSVHPNPVLLIAENLWAGTNYPREQIARAVIESWLKSPGHRENMLHQGARFAGVGVASAGRDQRVTALFCDFRR